MKIIKFSLVDGVGQFEEHLELHTQPNAITVVKPPRRIPHALKDRLREKLKKLEEHQIVRRVEHPKNFVISWSLILYLASHVPSIETRVDEFEQSPKMYREPTPAPSSEQPPPLAPAPADQHLKLGKCFHMSRDHCPPEKSKCARVDEKSVFCCDVDSFRLKEALGVFITQNTTNLHVLNATIDELDISQAVFRRLVSMAITDGNIGNIVGKFPKHSSIACLNISNNNLTSAKLQPASSERQFAYLYNLTVLDVSANNLTEFPLRVQSNRKISVDLSGNNYLPCKHYQGVMEGNTSSLMTFLNYNNTFCALDLQFNWFKDLQIVELDYIRRQRELNASCANIQPAHAHCTCVWHRLELMMGGDVTNQVAVDCSQRQLTTMPTVLPPNTLKLNVSYNNISSLEAVSSDRTYTNLRQLIVDHNNIQSIVELEGTRFINEFVLFSLSHNKLKTIHTYVLSNKFDLINSPYITFSIGGNYIHCDCNSEKVLKPWLLENARNIPDYKSLLCENDMGAVADLIESRVCHTPRDWTDYIYYIIGLEVLVLVLLISKVTYDYWIFKTAGYLPWPANKMPRLPCDWLCE